MRRLLVLSATLAFGTVAGRAAAAPWEDIDLGGLPEIRALGGVAAATLHAAPADITIGQVHFTGWVYNGAYTGPVIHVRPGDAVQIDLDNTLPEATNLHFHGLRVTPLGSGDNVHVVVLPGTRHRTWFRIPADHPPGLFWFHDHLHGESEKHVNAGLSGTVLIDGFAREFDGLDDVPQKLLVLKDYTEPGCNDPVLKGDLHCRLVTVNGQMSWTDAITPGSTQLWRIVNEGPNLTLHLATQGLRLRIIGRDGTPAMRAEETQVLDVMPAARVDALVTAHGLGTIPLLALHVPTGTGAQFKASRQIGIITVAGATTAPPVITPVFPAQRDLRLAPLNNRRTVVFSEDPDSLHFYIDGKLFSHDRMDIRVPLGTIEEWTVQNKSQDFHVFHIHQLGFQVIEINGVKQDFDGFVDNVSVPEMGEVKLLLPFTDPVMLGRFVFHCHVLKHEDAGMMANIEVYRPDQGWTAPICHTPLEGVNPPAPQTPLTPDMLRDAAALLQGLNNSR
jgi:FtsP/CotA-like multicopper oxidase with cupredoxin domain